MGNAAEAEITPIPVEENLSTVKRLTAIWAFSESVMGGILHALKIPLTGIFIGGAAVILISLIARYSSKTGTILRATILVMAVKGVVSPHTPLNAYFAVFLQGLLGELFFLSRNHIKLSSMLLAVVTTFLSSIQKIVMLTIVFGKTFWESIDLFAEFVISQFSSASAQEVDFSLSYILIAGYVGLHLAGGVIIGLIAGNLPNWLKNKYEQFNFDTKQIELEEQNNFEKSKKKKRVWWKRPSAIFIFGFFAVMVFISYYYPELGKNRIYEILIMFVRSIFIMFFWYALLSPVIFKFITNCLQKKKSVYSEEIDNIVAFFPHFKQYINYSWRKSAGMKGFKRAKMFFTSALVLILLSNINLDNTENH